MKMQCGHIIVMFDDTALLCTKDFGHKGNCGSQLFRRLIAQGRIQIFRRPA